MARLSSKERSRRETEGPQRRKAPGTRCARLESLVGYPKPVDLCLDRLKPLERGVEDRTGNDVQIFRMIWA